MDLKKISEGVWEFKEAGMGVPGRMYGTEKIINALEEGVFRQVSNVSKLPGLVKASMAMPDAHWGYGFPIGGVAAFDLETGVISPGGVGYDINCGVRLLTTNLDYEGIKPKLNELMDLLFRNVPSGVGSKSQRFRASDSQLLDICENGSVWAVESGYGVKEDIKHTEESGRMKDTDFSKVSDTAKKRGKPQIGTLGSGNHFLEVQRVDQIFDPVVAKKFGLEEGSVAVMIHCGSRGLGYQVADDYIKVMLGASRKYNINLPDRQLACAPLDSSEARSYIGAMNCAINYAFANRQMITHWVRESFYSLFGESVELKLLYDVCHNIAKFEEHHTESGGKKTFCVHRKGATRSFGAGRVEIPAEYRTVGQPVIIPGDMGTASYVLVGTEKAMEETWGSTCHGAGRTMSRHAAVNKFKGDNIKKLLESRGEVIRATSPKVLAEEVPDAYKDIDEVIRSVEIAGLSKAVARMVPMGVAKG